VVSAGPIIINIPADYYIIQAGIDASSDGDAVSVEPHVFFARCLE
jgi:hypothetical protein